MKICQPNRFRRAARTLGRVLWDMKVEIDGGQISANVGVEEAKKGITRRFADAVVELVEAI